MNTKRSTVVFAAIMAATICLSTQSIQAQTRVAIVDVGRIFKSHPEFTQQLELLKKQADDFKASSIQAQQDLVQKAEGLKQFKPGTPDYQSLESQLAQASAAMEVNQRVRVEELMLAEAKLHFDTYNQVNNLIGTYCDSQGIQLVLRYNSDEMNPKDPASVMQRVNGSVIYNKPSTDITDVVIRQLGGVANAAANSNLK